MKKNIITIAGRPGSGKSTTAKAVADRLRFKHFSSGDLFRSLGKEYGVDVLDANQTAGVTEKLDEMVDSKLRQIGQEEDDIVIDSRTAWHWIPLSFKVFLNLELEEAARRILNKIDEARQGSENMHQDPARYAAILKRRLDVETKRYKTIYNIDPYDMSNYDLVIDTARTSIEQTIQQVVEGFKGWQDE